MLRSSRDFNSAHVRLYELERTAYPVLLAWRQGQVVGMLSGSFDADFNEYGGYAWFEPPRGPHAYLDRIHVHEAARGESIGAELLLTYVAEAASHGCTFVAGNVDLTSAMTDRKRFFTQHGFRLSPNDEIGALQRDIH